MEVFTSEFYDPILLNDQMAQYAWAPADHPFDFYPAPQTSAPAPAPVETFTVGSSSRPLTSQSAAGPVYIWPAHSSLDVVIQEDSLPSSPSSDTSSSHDFDSSLTFSVGSFDESAASASHRVSVKQHGRSSNSASSAARMRRAIRPKVIESKGTMQCAGRNRKKGTQCRNAALMEHIGPKPIYCAEHIELDPNSLYEKCKAGYQKERGDQKSCKEVVLKEFGLCYKHFPDLLSAMVEERRLDKVTHVATRVGELLAQLEREAAIAKRTDADLYQRKNKLIPKIQEMKKVVLRFLHDVGNVAMYDQLQHGTFASNTIPNEMDDEEPLSDELSSEPYSSSPHETFDYQYYPHPHSDAPLQSDVSYPVSTS